MLTDILVPTILVSKCDKIQCLNIFWLFLDKNVWKFKIR